MWQEEAAPGTTQRVQVSGWCGAKPSQVLAALPKTLYRHGHGGHDRSHVSQLQLHRQ